MGGEIRVVKKNGPGTLMQLYLVLGAPIDGTREFCNSNFSQHNLTVSSTILQLEGLSLHKSRIASLEVPEQAYTFLSTIKSRFGSVSMSI